MLEDNTDFSNLQQDTQNLLIQQFAEYYATLTKKQRRVFWVVHGLILKYDPSKPKQATVARIANCSREFANRTINALVKNGYLYAKRRSRSSIYTLPKSLHNLNLNFLICAHLKSQNITSEITSHILLEANTDKALRPVFDPLSYLEDKKYIRNTNSKSYSNSIKPILKNIDISESDKIAFSRYQDHEIEYALDQLTSFSIEKGLPNSTAKFLQAKLSQARKGKFYLPKTANKAPYNRMGLDQHDAASFLKYPEASIVLAIERTAWYQSLGRQIGNRAAFMHGILKKCA